MITTVDAVNGARQLDAQPESIKQVAVADRLVLTKTDLATPEATDRLTQRLRHINPGAPLWRGAEDDLDAAALLSADDDGVERWQPEIAMAIRPTVIIATPMISELWRSTSTSRSIGRGSVSG